MAIKPLRSVLQDSFKGAFSLIGKDPFSANSFLYARTGGEGGIVWYDQGKKTVICKNEYMACVLFEEDRIWVCLSIGLIRIHRSTGQIDTINGLPSIRINHIERTEDAFDRLVLNGTILYTPATGGWEYQAPSTDCQRPASFWTLTGMDISQQSFRAIHYTDPKGMIHPLHEKGGFQGNLLCARHSTLWTEACYQDTLVLNKFNFLSSSQDQFKFPQLRMTGSPHAQDRVCTNGNLLVWKSVEGWSVLNSKSRQLLYFQQNTPIDIRQVDIDSRNLYVLFQDRFMIVSLEWMLRRAVPMNTFYTENQDFQSHLDTIFQEQDLDRKTNLFQSLHARFDKTRNPFVRWQLKYYNSISSGPYYINISDSKSVAWMENQIAQGKMDSVSRAYYYENGVLYFSRQMNIEKARQYGKKYSNLTGNSQWIALKALQTFVRQRDSISRIGLPDDEYAYAYAVVIGNFCNGSPAFESESMADMSKAVEQYKKVTTQYPNSARADDAAFNMLEIDLFGYCEGGCDYWPKDLKRLDDFLKKYPESDQILHAWIDAANIALELRDDDPAVYRRYAKRGLEYLLKIKNKYPEFVLTDDYKFMQRSFRDRIDLFWEISAGSDNKIYKPGQPILISLTLQNLNDSTQTLTVNPHQLFFIRVSYAPDTDCARVDAPFKTVREMPQNEKGNPTNLRIPPRGSKKWTLNLMSDLSYHYQDYRRLGLYDFSKRGHYFITVEIQTWNMPKVGYKEIEVVVE
ncbi:MAG TPA: hypothetical protein PK914_10650 [Smithellaceae bacterium]|nr:hypothetical protein [Smithellaceae bacterium]